MLLIIFWVMYVYVNLSDHLSDGMGQADKMSAAGTGVIGELSDHHHPSSSSSSSLSIIIL